MQTAVVLATGELWLFLPQFPLANLCMCFLFARTAHAAPRRSSPELAAEVVALRQPATHHPGLHRFFQKATWLLGLYFLLLTAAWQPDGDRARQRVPDALDGRHDRPHRRRSRRVGTVVPLAYFATSVSGSVFAR